MNDIIKLKELVELLKGYPYITVELVGKQEFKICNTRTYAPYKGDLNENEALFRINSYGDMSYSIFFSGDLTDIPF